MHKSEGQGAVLPMFNEIVDNGNRSARDEAKRARKSMLVWLNISFRLFVFRRNHQHVGCQEIQACTFVGV